MATQVATYTPREILAFDGPYLQVPATILQGQVLLAGQVLGRIAASGKYAAYVPALTQNCATTTGSPTVTPTTMTGLKVGQTVTGAGIPAATTITAVGATTVTLSANATATAASVALTFTNADGSQTPELILDRNVDSTNQDEYSAPFVNGNFVTSLLTSYDANAAAVLLGRNIMGGTVTHIP